MLKNRMQNRIFILAVCLILLSGCALIYHRNRLDKELQTKGILCGEISLIVQGKERCGLIHREMIDIISPLDDNDIRNGRKELKFQRLDIDITSALYPFFYLPLSPGVYELKSINCRIQLRCSKKTSYIEYPVIPLKSNEPIRVKPGEFTYIGDIVIILPEADMSVEYFATALKNRWLSPAEVAAHVKSLGMDFYSGYPSNLIFSEETGYFYCAYVRDSINRFNIKTAKLFNGSAYFPNYSFKKELTESVGFQYVDKRKEK